MKNKTLKNKTFLISFLIAILSISTLNATVWIKNGDNTSAYTSPSPYDNDTDITETLSISGANSLDIDVSGTTENNYDYLYITDSDGNTRSFDGDIDTSYTVSGSSITIRFKSDYSVTGNGVEVSIKENKCVYGLDSNNHDSPGVVIPPLDGATSDVSTCFDGSTIYYVSEYDYYNFTAGADGIVDINFSSPDEPSIEYMLWKNGDRLYSISGNSNAYSFYVQANDQIIIRMRDISGIEFSGWKSYHADIAYSVKNVISSPRPFSLKKQFNINGNMKMIGNSIMLAPNGDIGTNNGSCALDTQNNSDVDTVYADMDNDDDTFNSTSSQLSLPSGVTGDDILYAGLFWQGRFINQTIPPSANQVLLKLPGDTDYTQITASDNFDQILDSAPTIRSKYNDYQGVADITQLLKSNVDSRPSPYSGDIWIADLQANTTSNSFGAWMLIVVYKDANDQLKNISIYDGFVSSSSTQDIVQTLSGFKTPKSEPVNAKFFIFGGEGDVLWDNDAVSLTKSDGTSVVLASNIFDSSIRENGANVTTRNPSCSNTIGIDIDSFTVGIPDGDKQIIGPNQTETTATISTPDKNYTADAGYQFTIYDQVFPGMFAFAADLYIPPLCYDYTVQIDDFDITEDNRTIHTIGTGTLSVNVAIKSEEGDFDLKFSNLEVKLNPTDDTEFRDAFYSPNTVNTLIPAIYSNGIVGPRIAVGEDANTSGGTIGRNQKYFTKFNYNLSRDRYEGNFDIALDTSIDFGSGPAPIHKSTVDGTLRRCDQTNIYNPAYGTFNVERHNSTGTPSSKYPLYTQVVSKDFDFDVVAYTNPPSFDDELPLNNYTVDVELINVKSYNDENGTFSCSNTDPGIIQTLTSDGKNHLFAKFTGSSRVSFTDELNVQTDRALRNAAFRIWYLVDKNGTIIQHTCTDENDDTCFQEVYDQHLKSSDTNGFCSDCSSYVNPVRGTSGCYACLRDHFAVPVCSRDNFAIRPVSYRLEIVDTNESLNPGINKIKIADNNNNQNVTDQNSSAATLAAGYKYRIDGNATSFAGAKKANGYRQYFDGQYPDDLYSKLQFKDKTTCVDKNDTSWNITFINGSIVGVGADINLTAGNLIRHNNAGLYAFHVLDKNWTIVDQQRYQYKTFPDSDDCVPDDNTIPSGSTEKPGCDISSVLTSNTGGEDIKYNDLYLYFQPYKFSLVDINFSTSPANQNYLFMTDFDDPYYQTTSSFVRTMAAIHEGNITALGKTNIITTNFTDGCAAEDITIVLNRETNDTEENLEDLYGVKIQQYLSYGSTVDMKTSFDDKQEGKDANLTLSKAAFEDAVAQGSARIRVYTNFKKPAKDDILDGSEGIDPIIVNYLEINASSKDANSTAHLSAHIPKGSKNFDRNITFVYGRVLPQKKLYIEKEHNWKETPLYVNIYCGIGSLLCAQRYDLNTSSLSSEASSNWYQASNLFQAGEMGTSDLNVTHYGERHSDPRISHGTDTNKVLIENVGYDPVTATQTDINVTIQPTDPKPTTVRVEYFSDPWLRYEDDFYDVRFMPKPTEWTGFGKTGHVVDDDINTYKTKRVEW